MFTNTGVSLNRYFNMTEEEATALIIKYLHTPWQQFLAGEVKTGEMFQNLVNRDELCANEKCYLCAHLSQTIEKFKFREIIEKGNFGDLIKEAGIKK